MFLIAKYKSVETRYGQLWFLPGGETNAQRYVANISKLNPIVANGTTSRMDLVQLQDGSANYESGPMFLLPLADVNEEQIQQLLIHTLTHATFFSRRPWIFEGLAHYAQARTVEDQFGRLGALQYLAQRRPALALAEPANGSGQSLIQAEQEIFYRTKAMFVWWMLRDLVGESTLNAALAKYRVDQDREPAYMQRLLEAESKKNLETFFDDWVYRDRGLPDFRITNVYTRQHLRGGYLSTVTVENTGTAGAEVLVQLRAKQTGGEERLYVPAGKSASVRIELPLAPVEATVNDGGVPEVDVSNNTYTVEAAKQ